MSRLFILILVFISNLPLYAEPRFIDVHTHFNWDMAEITSAESVIEKINASGAHLTIVTSTPTHLALQIKSLGGDKIIPFFSPYTHELGKHDWFMNADLPEKVSQGLASGEYAGIGEIHFMAGFPPATSNQVFIEIMQQAKKYRVPAMIHVDARDEELFMRICQGHPEVSIIFAHAGGNLLPEHIEKVINGCPNVWIEFSARDPWRYDGLTGTNGLLLEGWRNLVLKYPTRFVVGTDAVWRVTRGQSWGQSDEGWQHYQMVYDYHQKWLAELPFAVSENLQWRNAFRLLDLEQP